MRPSSSGSGSRGGPGRCRGAHPDRPRAARHRVPLDQRGDHPDPGGPPAARSRPRGRGRRPRGGRGDRPRGAGRDAAAVRGAAGRGGVARRWRRSPVSASSNAWCARSGRARWRCGCEVEGDPVPLSPGRRPGGVPHRPGGPDQRGPARRGHARRGCWCATQPQRLRGRGRGQRARACDGQRQRQRRPRPGRASGSGWPCTAAPSTWAPSRPAGSGSRRACRSEARCDDRPAGDRRRPGHGAGRVPLAARRRAGHRGRRRGRQRRGGGRGGLPAAARRDADGHPDAGARRHRRDPAAASRPGWRPRCWC